MTALVWSYSDHEPGELWVHQSNGRRSWHTGLARRQPRAPERGPGADGQPRPATHQGARRPRPAGLGHAQRCGTGPLAHRRAAPRWPLGAWQRMALAGHGAVLASRGYLVIEPEFRAALATVRRTSLPAGSNGARPCRTTWPTPRCGHARGLANDKACVAGASYGGYSTLMGLVKHPELYRCGSLIAVADLDLFIQGSWLVDDDVSDVGPQVQPARPDRRPGEGRRHDRRQLALQTGRAHQGALAAGLWRERSARPWPTARGCATR